MGPGAACCGAVDGEGATGPAATGAAVAVDGSRPHRLRFRGASPPAFAALLLKLGTKAPAAPSEAAAVVEAGAEEEEEPLPSIAPALPLLPTGLEVLVTAERRGGGRDGGTMNPLPAAAGVTAGGSGGSGGGIG